LTKSKGILANGNRLENASWRRWYQKKFQIKSVDNKDMDSVKQHSELDSHIEDNHLTSPCLKGILESSKNEENDIKKSKEKGKSPKKRKKVRFDESKNQTTYLRFVF